MRAKMDIRKLLRITGEIRRRSRLLACKYPLLRPGKMSSNAFHLRRRFRELGISVVPRDAVPDEKQVAGPFRFAGADARARRPQRPPRARIRNRRVFNPI